MRSERPGDRGARSLLASGCSHPTRRTTLPATPTSDWIAPVRVAPLPDALTKQVHSRSAHACNSSKAAVIAPGAGAV